MQTQNQKDAASRYYDRNRDAVIARSSKRAKEHPEEHAAYAKRWRDDNPERCVEKRRREKYGLTSDAWNALFDSQGRCCASCGATEPGGRGWCVDHDHACCDSSRSCGKCIRGILCHSCNVILGFAKDSPTVLAKIVAYAELWRQRRESGRTRIPCGEASAG